MKRYIALIITSLLVLGIVGFLFYLLLRQNNATYVTYIKFQVNPSFVIGINKNENVIFYNGLNSDANKYNLSMFQGKSLGDATEVFLNKLGSSNENKDTINITVMTKNVELEKHITDIITQRINEFDAGYKVNILEATRKELENYSNEIIYNLENTYNLDELKNISKEIYDQVDSYVVSKMQSINTKKMKSDEIIELLSEYKNQNYFNELNLNSINLSVSNTTIGKNSKYEVFFTLNDENQVDYHITLNLEINYTNILEKTVVETYDYQYEIMDDFEKVSNLKKYFYTF